MKESEYKRARKTIEAELKSAQENLAKVQAKIDALDLVWREHFSHGSSHCDPLNGEPQNDTSGRAIIVNGQAQLMIDEAALGIPGEFGVREIESAIHTRHPDKTVNRTTIAGRLRKLADDGKIELVEAGVGRRPGKFRGRVAA